MLGSYPLVAFIATHSPDLAKRFYRDTLGLRLVSEDKFALVFDAHGTMLRISIVQDMVPAKYTVLGWQVPDILAVAQNLEKAGVKLERFPNFHGQDERGILDRSRRRQGGVVQRPGRKPAKHHPVLTAGLPYRRDCVQ